MTSNLKASVLKEKKIVNRGERQSQSQKVRKYLTAIHLKRTDTQIIKGAKKHQNANKRLKHCVQLT